MTWEESDERGLNLITCKKTALASCAWSGSKVCKTIPKHHKMILRQGNLRFAACLLLAAALHSKCIIASAGDRLPEFRQCVDVRSLFYIVYMALTLWAQICKDKNCAVGSETQTEICRLCDWTLSRGC